MLILNQASSRIGLPVSVLRMGWFYRGSIPHVG